MSTNKKDDDSPVAKLMADISDNPIVGESAQEIGLNLLTAMIDEMSSVPHPSIANQSVWSTQKPDKQEEIIERFKRRVRDEVQRFVQVVMADGNPAVRATLAQLVFSDKGCKASLEIPRAHGHAQRHALVDFQGQDVAIIMAKSLESYFESMKDMVVQPVAAQASLDLDPRPDENGEGIAPPDEASGAGDEEPKANSPEDLGFQADDATAQEDAEAEIPPELDDDAEEPPVDENGNMPINDLIILCAKAAAAIGEDSLNEEVFATYGREQLEDYLQWATKKKRDDDGE